jgi:hypothetical protein
MNGNNARATVDRAVRASSWVVSAIAALSGVIGVFVGAFGVAFYVRDELKIWEDIKRVHLTELPDANATIAYDHQQLNESELRAIKAGLGLPDFSTFALKAEVPTIPDLGVYVKYGDKIIIASEYLDWTLQGRQDGAGAFIYSKQAGYENSDEWYLRK